MSVLVVTGTLITAAVADFRYLTIPNWCSVVAAAFYVPFAYTLDMPATDLASHYGTGALLYLMGLGLVSRRIVGGGDVKLVSGEWSFAGPFGYFDKGAMQRGFQVYLEVCAGCHGMRLVSYRNLMQLGYSEEQVKAFAAEFEVTDGPNDEGEMYERTAKPSDRFVSPFPNENAARAGNNGALPPDLSLIVDARAFGMDFIGYTKN